MDKSMKLSETSISYNPSDFKCDITSLKCFFLDIHLDIHSSVF